MKRRLKIIEMLNAYNVRHPKLTMRDVAMMAYADQGTTEGTKYNRISSLNSGKLIASIDDVVRIAEVLDCNFNDLI